MKRKRGDAAEPPRGEPVHARGTAPAPPPRRPLPGNRYLRWAINLWILFHFAAVLAAASSVAPTSELLVAVWKPFRPYLQALYLNHGYNFYAPQPAPSTLVAYEVDRADGTSVRGRILERSVTPRLLYHRYLLLTEHLVFISEDLQKHWYESYAHHLCHKYAGSRVGFTRVMHYPATTEMIRNGQTLDDPATYEEMFVGRFECGDH